MSIRNKTGLLLTLLLSPLLCNALPAMNHSLTNYPVTPPDPIKKIKPANRQQLRGPAYKSHRATGRNLKLNRAAGVGRRVRATKAIVSGPAYKNRKPAVGAVEVPPPTKERITGPRYKNRNGRAEQKE
ncbi:hypothetical protein [Neolewinella agarilytica]|uniref:hypothetical protein n=1 Tax=Neolewinella agarilytica TaxID=478744 RepID=UPI00235410BB|nr:hypothetical protein [Neolewinella agarilytica]